MTAAAKNGMPAISPLGTGPSSLAEPVSDRHNASGRVAAALTAPWHIDGVQMLPLFSYSRSQIMPIAIVNTQNSSIPTMG